MSWDLNCLAICCATYAATCATSGVAQDVLGYSVRMEPIAPMTALWWAELKLYVDSDLEVDRPYVREFSGADTLWLLNRFPLLPDGQIVLKTYAGAMVQDLGPATVNASFIIGHRVPDITNIPNPSATYARGNCTMLVSPFSPVANLPVVFSHQNTIAESQGVYTWNPNIWDPDGDSLAIAFEPCAEGHWLPANSQIDSLNGTITTAPDAPGRYAFCAKVTKYRQLPHGWPIIVTGTSRYEVTFDVTTVVGAAEQPTSQDVQALPNPASNRISVSSGSEPIHYYRLVGADGRLASEGSPNELQFDIECSSLARGLYFLALDAATRRRLMRIVLE